ncbi:hypothetical protein [Brachybacterium hainanense]|uniref:Uncharacterized protein n=1 Tax=Brachybacterium hainanense TaxID=1541174 RepID=A0ABV6R988_9MICO
MATRRAADRDPELDATPAPPDPAPDPLKSGRPGDYVRVRHPDTGDHYTTTRMLASIQGATLLPGHEAVDRLGHPLPRKRNISKETR